MSLNITILITEAQLVGQAYEEYANENYVEAANIYLGEDLSKYENIGVVLPCRARVYAVAFRDYKKNVSYSLNQWVTRTED